MEVLTTRELKERLDTLQGKEICLQGWIRNHRRQKNIGFIDFFDGTCFKNPQVVYDENIQDFAAVSALHVGAAITVRVKKADAAATTVKRAAVKKAAAKRAAARAADAADAAEAVLLRSFWKAKTPANTSESITEEPSTTALSLIPPMTGASPWSSSAAPA